MLSPPSSSSRLLLFAKPRKRMMAQFFQRIWDRAQGKLHVLSICDKVFAECADKDKQLLELNTLHLAILMVYNSINKQLLGPHKDPPSMQIVAKKIESYRSEKGEGIDLKEFRELIMEWTRKDLHLVLVNKAAVAFLAAPLLAVMTKNAGKQVPKIRNAVEKVPTPLLFSIYSVGLMLLQDARLGKN